MKQPELTDHQKELFEKLTKLQRRVVIGVIGGLSQRQAYKEAGGTAKTGSAQSAGATEILNNPNVKDFLISVQENQISDAILTQNEALELLTTDARNHELEEEYKDLARVRHSAIKQIGDIKKWTQPGTTINNQQNVIVGVISVPEDKTLDDFLEGHEVVDVE